LLDLICPRVLAEQKGKDAMSDEDMHRIELRAQTIEELRDFLDGTDLDLGCRPAVRQRSGELIVDVYATMPQIERLRAARSASGVTVRVVENASETGRARQAEVGSGNRFAGKDRLSGQQTPRGLGIKE